MTAVLPHPSCREPESGGRPDPRFAKVVGRLNIPPEFLRRYSPAVRQKFQDAASVIDIAPEDGISRCLHLASSIVLRNPEYLDKALGAIAESQELRQLDPPRVLTVVAVYYLLARELGQQDLDEVTRDAIGKVQKAFAAKQWLIGRDAMCALEMG